MYKRQAIDRAIDELTELAEQPDENEESREETLGLLASCNKSMWLKARALDRPPEKIEELMRSALDAYGRGWRETDRYWTGINYATIAKLLGQEDVATEVAENVQDECERLMRKARRKPGELDANSYWALATLAQARFVLAGPAVQSLSLIHI